ncbi:MAG: helix-turn-helix transcriptional regulator [Sporocytophaga sp.]|nr:helix-turn-helix transcriptional regulator [Sporocytophaga sp.]
MDNANLKKVENCSVSVALNVIGGKWKMLIVYLIMNDINRFGKLNMILKDISKQMLTTQLRELEQDGLIDRVIYPEIPPRVEYFLTQKGKALIPIMDALKLWADDFLIKDVSTSESV